jgi:hypothetical protein
VRIAVPRFAGIRDTARAVVAALPEALGASEVVVDMADTKAVAPSFIDELIRQVLVERGAFALTLHDAPARAIDLAVRFADNHHVGDRLRVPASPVS